MAALLRVAEQALGADGDLLVVHWRHHPSDAYLSGAAANSELSGRPGWRAVAHLEDSDFVLDVLTRAGAQPTDADQS